jgi:hypothetical protein
MRENFRPLPRARLLKVSELWSGLFFFFCDECMCVWRDMGSYGRKEGRKEGRDIVEYV